MSDLQPPGPVQPVEEAVSLYSVLEAEEAPGDRQATDVMLVTFNADLAFFEARILGRLRAAGARVTVIADAGVWDPDPRAIAAAGRQYHLGLIDAGGAFHPKVMLLAGPRRVVASVGSGNLTFGGWHFNSELLTVFRSHIAPGGAPPPAAIGDVANFFDDLARTGLLDPIAASAVARTVATTRRFLRQHPNPTAGPDPGTPPGTRPGECRVFSSLSAPLLTRLPEGPVVDLCLSAPFHDPASSAMAAILKRMQPRGDVQVAVQPGATSVDLAALRRVLDAHTTTATTARIVLDGNTDPVTGKTGRYRHGKLIEWTTLDGQRWAMTGSPNLSRAALLNQSKPGHPDTESSDPESKGTAEQQVRYGGNVEAAVVGPIEQSLFHHHGPLPQEWESRLRLLLDPANRPSDRPPGAAVAAAAYLAGPWHQDTSSFTHPALDPAAMAGTLIRLTLTRPLPPGVVGLSAEVSPLNASPDDWYPTHSIQPAPETGLDGPEEHPYPSGAAGREWIVKVPAYHHSTGHSTGPAPRRGTSVRLHLEGTSRLRLTWTTEPTDDVTTTATTDGSEGTDLDGTALALVRHHSAPVPITDPRRATALPPPPGTPNPLKTQKPEDLYDDTETLDYLPESLLALTAALAQARGPAPTPGHAALDGDSNSEDRPPRDTVGRFTDGTLSGDWAETRSNDWATIQSQMYDLLSPQLASFILAIPTGDTWPEADPTSPETHSPLRVSDMDWADTLADDTDDADLETDTAESLDAQTSEDHPDVDDPAAPDDHGPTQPLGPDGNPGDPQRHRMLSDLAGLPDYRQIPAKHRRRRQRAITAACHSAPQLPLHFGVFITRWLLDSWAAGLWPVTFTATGQTTGDEPGLALVERMLAHLHPAPAPTGAQGDAQSGERGDAWAEQPPPEVLARAASLTLVALAAIRDRADTLDPHERYHRAWRRLARLHGDHALDADDNLIATFAQKVRNRHDYPLDPHDVSAVWELLVADKPARAALIEALRFGRDGPPLDAELLRDDFIAVTYRPNSNHLDQASIRAPRTDPEELALWVATMATHTLASETTTSPATDPAPTNPQPSSTGLDGTEGSPHPIPSRIAVHVTCHHRDPTRAPAWALLLWNAPDLVIAHDKKSTPLRWRHQQLPPTVRLRDVHAVAAGGGAQRWVQPPDRGPKHAATPVALSLANDTFGLTITDPKNPDGTLADPRRLIGT